MQHGHERQAVGRERRGETGQRGADQVGAGVAEDRLRDDEVEIVAAAVGAKIAVGKKARALDAQDFVAKLPCQPILNQPGIGIEPGVVSGSEIGDQQPPEAQRTAAEIEHLVSIAKAERGQQRKLARRHEVVLARRSDIGHVMRRADRQLLGLLVSEVARIGNEIHEPTNARDSPPVRVPKALRRL
jgi:hypothetical protein